MFQSWFQSKYKRLITLSVCNKEIKSLSLDTTAPVLRCFMSLEDRWTLVRLAENITPNLLHVGGSGGV